MANSFSTWERNYAPTILVNAYPDFSNAKLQSGKATSNQANPKVQNSVDDHPWMIVHG